MWSGHKIDQPKVFNPAGPGMVWCEYQKFDDNTKVSAAPK